MTLRTHAQQRLIVAVASSLLFASPVVGTEPANKALPKKVDFDRDIRPILSDTCYACHGPDATQRKAELSLHTKAGALADRGDYFAIVPGNAEDSHLFRRITSADDDERMPPADTGRKLTPRQIALLRRWIEQGAPWQEHWAFVPPRRPPLPEVDQRSWPRGAIDHFILARLDRAGLRPSRESDPQRLLRRVTLDLTGLPPAPHDIDAFSADKSPAAYSRAVDRLLASPRFGERMAAAWLDLARYADTDGYQDDEPRVMWRWRDWLIEALNANQPFDQFTIEQLAGDLLPNATLDQRLATGFHRNHRTNGEGGSIPEEFRVEYVIDRVSTTATVWLGLTVGCARCHDHKYDPITQRDFYRLFAYFNNVPEQGTSRRNAPPTIKVPPVALRRRLDVIDHLLAAAPTGAVGPLSAERDRLLKDVPDTMVLAEGKPRETFVLLRGQYDKPGEKVTAGVPASLPPLAADAPTNRLGLAQWLVDPAHPLTARVTVNRLWQMLFGAGLVRTAEDFGIQGERPSHPELLDWLATEFVRSGWDVKAMVRLMVTSATYRQSSEISAVHLARDPDNRLLARGPRLRLPAEMVRDQALAAAGLLVERAGGPTVKPYQPEGLWDEIAGGATGAYKTGYRPGRGTDLYRRSIYTFWRRTIPPPSMALFDAPSREICTVRRARTNTPLQALALLNDVTYVEAARALAGRVLAQGGTGGESRVSLAFRLVTARRPDSQEREVLLAALKRYQGLYRADPVAARELIAVGKSPLAAGVDPVELAAYTALANVILNLDETVTRE